MFVEVGTAYTIKVNEYNNIKSDDVDTMLEELIEDGYGDYDYANDDDIEEMYNDVFNWETAILITGE